MTYRLIKGIVSKTVLQQGNAVADFPRQTDQPDLIDWGVYGDRDVYIPYSDLFEAFDGGIYENGNGQFEWDWWLSPLQLKYLLDNFTEAGRRDALVTVETEDKPSGGGDWIVVVARLHLRDGKRELQREGGTLFRLTTQFVDAYPAPDGCDLTVSISDGSSPVWEEQESQDVTYAVTNTGDFSTTTDIVLTVPIATKLNLDGVSASGWTTEYDTGSGYSSSAPGDLTTVTSLRFTRASSLAAETGADVITLTYLPDASGAEAITAAVTTSFESNTDNNDATLAINIDP